MTIKQTEYGTELYADDGRAIRPIATRNPVVESVLIARSDSPENWEDCDMDDRKGEVMKYSTLSIKRELAKLGKWDAAKALIETRGAWDDYILANYLAETDPVFVAAKTAFVSAGILTQAQLDELLPKCVWTAE